jgi:hypothetical protein
MKITNNLKNAGLGFLSLGILCNLILEVYVRLPTKILYGSDPAMLPEVDCNSIFLLFPGFDGPDLNTERIVRNYRDADIKYRKKRFVYCYDWRNWRKDIFRAAYDSEYIGQLLGEQIAYMKDDSTGENKIKDIHIVGVSAGSFAANAVIKAYKRAIVKHYGLKALRTVHTRLSLLDPFTLKGATGFNYGINNFGKEADFCEHFLNSDDPVPSTNTPVKNAYVYDITKSKDREKFTPLPGDNMHSWPAAYFGMKWKTEIDPRLKNPIFGDANHDSKPRGSVIQLIF